MGNVLETPKSGDVHHDDSSWLGTHHSAIFNEAYVASVYEDLPKFEDTEVDKNDTEVTNSAITEAVKIVRLMEIFSKSSGGVSCAEDFQILNNEELEKSPFSIINRMRARLLQRIHLAILREAEFAQEFDVSHNENFLKISEELKNFEDANALLTASSVRMVIAFVKCLGPANPELFRSMSETLLDLLTRSSCLALSKVEPGSPQAETVQAIMSYAEDMATTCSGEDRAHALALMFAVGVTSGSVHDLLSVAKRLKDGTERLPDTAHTFMKRLQGIKTDLKLSLPCPDSIAGDFKLNITMNVTEKECEFASSALCTDGVFIFCWDSINCALYKVGTGFHGSIAGNQYVCNKEVEAQIRDRLGEDVFQSSSVNAVPISPEPRPNDTVGSSGSGPRRIRVMKTTHIVDVGEEDIIEVMERNVDPEEVETVHAGYETEVLEDRVIEVGSGDSMRSVTIFRISSTRWLMPYSHGELNFGDDEDDDDDDEDEDDSFPGSEDGYSEVSSIAVELMGDSPQPLPSQIDITSPSSDAESTVLNSPNAKRTFGPVWLACIHGKVYLRMKHLLGPHRLAIFSTTALKLEDIIDIDIPIPELVKAKKERDRCRRVLEGKGEDCGTNVGENDDGEGEEECEEEVEWQLGNEVNFASTEDGASVVAASSNFMISGGLSERRILGEDAGSEDPDNRFLFADCDSSQYLILDLGQPRSVDRIGASFPLEVGFHPVQESFIVRVSSDGVSYSEWGNNQGMELASPCYFPRRDDFPGLETEVRYIRFEFGRNVDNSAGSAITRLFVFGRPKIKKVAPIPFPILVSDGRHLIFVHSVNTSSLQGGHKEHFLQTFSVDPLDQSWDWKIMLHETVLNESSLHHCSPATNGDKLFLVHRKGFAKRSSKDNEIEVICIRLDMLSGKQLGISELVFPKAKGFLSGLTYDSRNNMLWTWDSFTQHVNRWRNDGLAPRFGPPRPIDDSNLLLSFSPHHRLHALSTVPSSTMDSEAEAALILCHLDRLSELFSSPLMPAAESRAADEIEVTAAGLDDAGGSFCRLLVRGQNYGTHSRGFNLVALNDQLVPEEARNFDTFESSNASERMADFIDGIPDGGVVLVATMDSATVQLTARGIAALGSIGAEHIERLQTRGSFVMVGHKGASPGSVPQQMADKRKGPVTVRLRLPTPKVPLSVEASPQTISTLVRLISSHYDRIEANEGTKFEKVMLISCLRLLTANVFQLLRGSSIAVATEIFCSEDRKTIMEIVLGVISQPPQTEGGDSIAEGAFRLFVTSIDVLYPSPGEKCSLLVRYLDEFVNETLSDLERSVLELLLRQMSDPSALIRLLHGKEGRAVFDPISLVRSMLSIAKKESILRMTSLVTAVSGRSDHDSHLVGVAAVQMLATLCNMILSQASQSIVTATVDTEGILSDDSGGANIQLMIELLEASSALLESGLLTNSQLEMLKNVSINATEPPSIHCPSIDVEVDEALKDSPVGALLPTVTTSMSLLMKSHGHKLLRCGIADIANSLTKCLSQVQAVVKVLPKQSLLLPSSVECNTTAQSAVFESEHPYASNTDRLTEILFKGAFRIVIIFDEKSKTENNYDYVRFYKDSLKNETWHAGIDKFTGRNGNENWPGYGGRPPLVIDGDAAWVEFHSDGSNEDWGWRFTAIAEFKRQQNTPQIHWLRELERQLSYCGAVVSSSLIVSVPWESPIEDRNAVWMEDNMFESGVDSSSVTTKLSPEDQFLMDLVDRPVDSLAATLVKRMKTVVMEDRGQVEQINRAVYATCAVLVMHNNIVNEAMAIAEGVRDDIPDSLIKVWRAGQKMRQYFEVGDGRSAFGSAPTSTSSASHAIPVLKRASSTSDSLRQTADEILKRAKFLLRLRSIPGKDGNQKALLSEKAVAGTGKKTADQLQQQRNFSSPYGAVMAKGSDLSSEIHDDATNSDLQATTKIKELQAKRRRHLQRLQSSSTQTKSITTEKVIRFLQSNHNVEQLEKLRSKRNQRARYRVQGFNLLHNLLKIGGSPFSLKVLLSNYSKEIKSTKRSERPRARTHYMNAIEGCSHPEYEAVRNSFTVFLNTVVGTIASSYKSFVAEPLEEKSEWLDVVISAVRACAMDYNHSDHEILSKSDLLSTVSELIQSEDGDILSTSWGLFELLVERCVCTELQGQGHGQRLDAREGSTDFNNMLLNVLMSEMERAAMTGTWVSSDARNISKPALSSLALRTFDEGRSIIPHVMELRRDTPGLSHPHIDLGLFHTFSLWIRRKISPLEHILSSDNLIVGCRVCRGPHWTSYNEDGGPESYGTVTGMEGNMVTVTWDNKAKKSYRYSASDTEEKIFEVVAVDEGLGGVIYNKGAPGLLDDETASLPWSWFGLTLTNRAEAAAIIAGMDDRKTSITSKKQIPPECWTHVAVVQDKNTSKLYVNGSLEAEKVLESYMLQPGRADNTVVVVESPHPYRDCMDEYTVVEIPRATSISIAFDPQTKTEMTYDYIKFYKDDLHADYWGEEKYTGGRGGSASNWPGLHGRPPLRITGNRFVVYFKSDGSNNDWGYKMTCTAEVPPEIIDGEATIGILNTMPIYIGQSPVYGNGLRSAEVIITQMNVYQYSLSPDQVAILAESRPSEDLPLLDERLCFDTIAILQKTCQSVIALGGDVASQSCSHVLFGQRVLTSIFTLLARGTPAVQCAVFRLCSTLLPLVPVDTVDTQAQIAGLAVGDSFVKYLLLDVGKDVNVWSTFAESHNSDAVVRSTGDLHFGLLHAKLALLQTLASSEIWEGVIGSSLLDIMEKSENVITTLYKLSRLESGESDSTGEANDNEGINLLFAAMAFIGGTLGGVYPGAKAHFMVGDEGAVPEDCVVLAVATPPTGNGEDKSFDATWRGLKCFGDAFVIVLDSQPKVPLIVPRHKLVAGNVFAVTQSMNDFLHVHCSEIVNLFNRTSLIDCTDRRPRYLTKVVESDECSVYESCHPYLDNSDLYTHIKCPGAKKIIIEFDPQCRTESNCDFVRFYRDEGRSSHWGLEKYFGRDGDANWPGTGGRAPLVIPSDSCVLYFHSDASNNDWGYKFTVRAHCVVRTEPPPLPPLRYLSILSHLKLLGVKALNNLLENCSWIIQPSLSLLRAIVDTSLTKPPRISSTGVSSKPVMVESNHPYDHNKDEYIPVRVKGAKKLTITFDDQSATENSCDYVRFYKDDQRHEYWGESQYMGGKDGGNSNWPGMRGRPPLVIPSDQFVIYFHTDGSVNAWGWRMWVTGDIGSGEIESVVLAACVYRAQCHFHLLVEGPGKQDMPSDLDKFETVTGDTEESKAEFIIPDIDDHTMDDVTEIANSNSAENINCSVNWPRRFIINVRDTSEVAVRDLPKTDSTVLFNVPAGKQLIADAETGDWLHVSFQTTPAVSTGPGQEDDQCKSGWVQRRLGDLLYLIPCASSSKGKDSDVAWAGAEELVILEDDDGLAESSKLHSKHPMYSVEDGVSSRTFNPSIAAQSSPQLVLRGSANCFERTTADLISIATIGYAQDCLIRIISKWPSDIPFTTSHFGDPSRLLSFIKAVFIKESSISEEGFSSSSPSLVTLKLRLLDVVRTDDDDASDLCRLLVGFALRQLTEGLTVESTLRPTRAVVKTLESKHPYDDNMDQSWFVSFPGAKWIKIVFDKRSSSEKDCDYCVIYKNASKTDTWGPRYTGRSNNSEKVWAGVGTTPVCRVQSDSCVVHFHSDGSNTDWGFKMTCYGIIDEPTEEEKDRQEELKSSATTANTELACWILDFLVKERNRMVVQHLYAPSTIRILRRFMKVMPPNRKIFVVHLLTSMIQELPRMAMTGDTIQEFKRVKDSIMELCVASSKGQGPSSSSSSTASGSNISQLTQALVQAAVLVDESFVSSQSQSFLTALDPVLLSEEISHSNCETNVKDSVSMCKYQSNKPDNYYENSTDTSLRWNSDFTSELLEIDADGTILRKNSTIAFNWSTAVCSTQVYHFGKRRFDVRILKFSLATSSPMVGMICRSAAGSVNETFSLNKKLGLSEETRSFGWDGHQLCVNGRDPKPLGPAMLPGDVIGVEINFSNGTVMLYRNSALVCVAIGPIGSGAIIESELGRGPYYPATSLLHPEDSVQLVSNPSLVHTNGLSEVPSEMPEWFFAVQDSVMLLRSCALRELPGAILQRQFIPACRDCAEVVIESSHPYDNTPLVRSVFIPGAESLTVYFHETCRMGTEDVIRISGGQEEYGGGKQVIEMVGLAKGTSLLTKSDGVAIGDKVVRGPSWDWGDQDGGAGSFGEVIHIRAWKGKNNAGVAVRWKSNNNFEGLYRWDYEGHCDVMVVGQWESSRRPITINANELLFEVIPHDTKDKTNDDASKVSPSSGWLGGMVFNGTSSSIRISHRPELELDNDCTVEAWVRLSSDVTALSRGAMAVYPLVTRQIEIDGKMSQYSLQLGYPRESGPSVLVLHMVNQSLQTAVHIKGGLVSPGCWTHVAATITGRVATLLVNGCVVASGNIAGTRLASLDAPLYIGGCDGNHFRGCLYDVRIWSCGHSVAQIQAQKNDVRGQRNVGLVCHLLLNENPPSNFISDGSPGNESLLVESFDLTFDSALEPNVIPTGVAHGYKCSIKPNFPLRSISSQKRFRNDLERLRQQYTVGFLKHDIALVRYVNQMSKAKNISSEQLLRCKWSDIAPSDEELVRTPILNEIVQMELPDLDDDPSAGVEESKGDGNNDDKDSEKEGADVTKPLRPVEARFELLQMLNRSLMQTIAYVDLCMADKPWSVACLLAVCRGLVFECVKMPCWETAMQESCSPSGGQFELKLSRSRAAKHIRTGLPDHDARFMVFSQAFRQMHTMPPATLRRVDKLYNTVLMGERAQDAGGPYRESFAIYALELQSNALPLLVRTPNGRHSVGQNREKWVLNPGATSSTHMEMFAFMGKLMGIAMRTKEYLALNIPSIIWKLLVGETPITREDIEAIDLFQVQSLDSIRHIDLQGIDADSFSSSFFETFTTISTDDRIVEIRPDGSNIDVTFENRLEFCDLVEQYRLHEFDVQAASVRRGLATMVPIRLLSLFTWDQLEMMVCGVAEVDIRLLQKVTDYSSCSTNDEHVKFFWQTLEEFNTDERSMFLRFTWGRSRLPLTAEGFSQRFKLQGFGKSPPDNYFPVAHTCFFSLELPRYSSFDIMKDKLRYAIYNCQAIDGDDTSLGMQAAAMGWEE